MHEERLAVLVRRAQHVDVGELVEAPRCRLTLGDAAIDDVGDAAVGPLEHERGEVRRIHSRQVTANVVRGVRVEVTDRGDLGERPRGCRSDRFEHERDPRRPCALGCHGAETLVVARLVGDDVAAEVQDGTAEQAAFDQEQDVQDAPRALPSTNGWMASNW